MSQHERIESILRVLVGKPLRDTGRCAGLQWFSFGDLIESVTPLGSSRVAGEYALHVQCAWRLRDSCDIFVTSRDRFYPKDDPNSESPDFDWDQPGSNRCDQRIASFVAANCPALVVSVTSDNIDTLTIQLDSGIVLEVFPDDSLQGEHWRFFSPGQDHPHHVLAGSGLSEE